jgi:hypothetical protein
LLLKHADIQFLPQQLQRIALMLFHTLTKLPAQAMLLPQAAMWC